METEKKQFEKLYTSLINGNRNDVRIKLNRFSKAKFMRFIAYYNKQNSDWQETISDIYNLFNLK